MTDPRITAGREICECGHPTHAIPCPDTSGDDGEGHVTICGCHRTTLPRHPEYVTVDTKDGPVLYHSYAKAKNHFFSLESKILDANTYMDAQDARIKELESDTEVKDRRLGDLQLESIRQANKIKELEREIREAHKLVKLCLFPLRNRLGIQKRDEWLKRNAEKEQGK